MGGECNYLLRVGPAPERRLEFVPDHEWKSLIMQARLESGQKPPSIPMLLQASTTQVHE